MILHDGLMSVVFLLWPPLVMQSRAIRWLFPVLCLSACQEDARDVADAFVEAYFVESSQQRALSLSTGLAKKRLLDELLLVADVRRGGYTPQEARRSQVRFFFREARLAKTQGQVRYLVTVEGAGAETRRGAYVILRLEPEGWRVSNWSVTEEGRPARPPASPLER